MILTHEILHLLFFNNLQKRFPTNMISTPEVLRIGREHFGCNTYRGIEFERTREGKFMSNHIEELHYSSETISPDGGPNISKLTLAAMQDSGNYRGNYNKASLFKYGFKQGCEFLETTTCDSIKYPQYFCQED